MFKIDPLIESTQKKAVTVLIQPEQCNSADKTHDAIQGPFNTEGLCKKISLMKGEPNIC
jgi:hypothetical protein